MAEVDVRKHSIGRLEGLLFKGSTYLKSDVSRSDYLTWRDLVLCFVEKLYGPDSREYQSILKAFHSVERHGSDAGNGLTSTDMTNVLRVVISMVYKYLSRTNVVAVDNRQT